MEILLLNKKTFIFLKKVILTLVMADVSKCRDSISTPCKRIEVSMQQYWNVSTLCLQDKSEIYLKKIQNEKSKDRKFSILLLKFLK